MKIRKGKRKIVMRLIKIVGDESMTFGELYNKMIVHPDTKPRNGELTRQELSNLLTSYFTKAGLNNKKEQLWKNRNENNGDKNSDEK